MPDIIILDESLINKIAAGEVIERPASVVKELIENSIDSGADKIIVHVKEGGKSYIKVIDNGEGMSAEDAKLCWKRHSTSKIKSENDLFSINTLGFRGEALASMAEVSELTIITREEGSISGRKIVVKAGKILSDEVSGSDIGTMVEVKDLFFNTPARKKYMKSIESELRHITDVVTRYALIHPEIHFTLYHDGRELLNSPSTRDGMMNIGFIYGKDIARNLIEVNYSDDICSIRGFISKPVLSRSTKDDQSIYVNKRYIKKNSAISDAIKDAYRTLVMVNRFPFIVLDIELDPEKTDVNVHPQKSEIRLQDEKRLYDSVFNAIKKSFSENDLIPDALEESGTNKNKDFSSYVLPDISRKDIKENLEKYYHVEDSRQTLLDAVQDADKPDENGASRLPEMKILGIVNKTYIIAETTGNLVIIDQHAAAERILYERFTKQLKDGDVKVQELLNPEILELSPKRYSLASSNKEFLEGLGYFIEEFGPDSIIIRTIPVVLGKSFDKDLFIDFIDELDNKEKPASLELFFHEKIARMACRTAIKAGDDITLPQIKEYVLELGKRDIPYTCPHGRPILIRFSMYELEKMFKRIV